MDRNRNDGWGSRSSAKTMRRVEVDDEGEGIEGRSKMTMMMMEQRR